MAGLPPAAARGQHAPQDMEVVSECPLPVSSVLWRHASGVWALSVVVKATFRLAPGVSRLDAHAQEHVHEADVHWDDHASRSLATASDLAPFKRRPEVLVIGHAHAPGGKPVTSLVARIAIGGVDKAIEVRGDRFFDLDDRLSAAAAFGRMPLRWERAAGGPDTENPAGVPTGSGARRDGLGRHALPNLVPVGHVESSARDRIEPVGFGPIAPFWPARAMRLPPGRPFRPDRWNAAPLPEDLDPAFFNAAPRDQQLGALDGSESLLLENLHRFHAGLVTCLEDVRPRATVHWGPGVVRDVALVCDTLVVDTDRGIASLTFRGQVGLDHPQRPGRVVVTASAPPAPPVIPAWAASVENVASTLVLTGSTRALEPPEASDDAPTLPPSRLVTAFVPAGAGGPPDAPVLPFRADPSSGAEGAGLEDPLARTGTTALPFRPIEGALVGGSALGRSMRLRAPDASPSHTPSSPPPGPAEPPPAPPAVVPLDAHDIDDTLSGDGPDLLPPWTVEPPGTPFAPPPTDPREAPAPPPLLGVPAWSDVASTGDEATAGEEAPAASGAPSPAPPDVPEEGPPPIEDYPLERCARIAAGLARSPGAAAEILEKHALSPATWARLDEHWAGAMRDDAERRKSARRKAYDAAYVAQLEKERGPITVEEYAQIVVASERGDEHGVAERLGLPPEAAMSVRRVWIARTARDLELGASVRRALAAARG